MCAAENPAPSEARRRFHDLLLPGTIARAQMVPFYADLLNGVDPAEVTYNTLDRLPTVNKEVIRAAGRRAQLLDDQLVDEVLSTGTTGTPFVTVRGAREQAFIRKFYSRVESAAAPGKLIRGLHIVNPRHGFHVSVPSPFYFHRITLFDVGSFDYGAKVICETFADPGIEPRCTVISGGERSVRAFVDHLTYVFDPPFRSELRYALTFGHYVPAHFRMHLNKEFGIRVVDRYSLSEMFGGATEDLEGGWYHFDPVVVPEVVSTEDRRPLTEGVGELVLTALYPFQEAQPMIRYATGDLVEVTHSKSSQPETLAIRPLGRIRFGVPSPHGGWLVTATQLYDALDPLSGLARIPEMMGSPVIRDPHALGNPIYDAAVEQLDRSRHRLVLRCVPKQGVAPDQCESLRATISQRLCQESESLRSGVKTGAVELDVRFVDAIEKPFRV